MMPPNATTMPVAVSAETTMPAPAIATASGAMVSPAETRLSRIARGDMRVRRRSIATATMATVAQKAAKLPDQRSIIRQTSSAMGRSRCASAATSRQDGMSAAAIGSMPRRLASKCTAARMAK